MSHHHSHKICSNCGTEVQESFCSKCGQKYLDHKETLGHLFLHFFEDITHFDSRFHKSITPLFFKPRFLTNEYNAGKRTMYLNPVRMYFFVSLIYFLSFLLPQKPLFGGNDNDTIGYSIENDALVRITRKEKRQIEQSEINSNINFGSLMKLSIKTDSTKIYSKHRIEDSVAKIYANPKLSFFKKVSEAQSFKLSHMDKDIVREEISHDFTKNIPKMMFVLLPLFALLLKLLYWRRKIYFIDHAIFSIHFHCFVFLNFLLQNLIDFIYPSYYINTILGLGIFVYLFWSMKKVYHQKIGKTFIKYLMLIFSYFIFLLIAFFINGVITLILL